MFKLKNKKIFAILPFNYFVYLDQYVEFKNGLRRKKTCLGGLQTTMAQTSLRSLISDFVIRILERTISKLAIGGISIFLLVSVAD